MPRIVTVLLMLTTMPVTVTRVHAQNPVPTLAVLPFEATPSGRLLPPPQLGATAASLLVDALVTSHHFRVLDGRWLGAAARGDTPSTNAPLAAAAQAGVDYVVEGSITRFSTEQRGRTLGGLGLRLRWLGGYRRRTTEMAVSLLIRVVDVRTGEIVTTAIGDGRAQRRTRGLGALGAIGGGLGSSSASDFADTVLDEATKDAVRLAAQGLLVSAQRLRSARRSGEAPVSLPEPDDPQR